MSKLREILGAIVVAAALAAPAACTGQVRYAVSSPPPAPISEPVLLPRGQVWLPGNWANVDGRWVWRGGHFENARSGLVYVPGEWRRHGDQYVWVGGEWRSPATGMVQR